MNSLSVPVRLCSATVTPEASRAVHSRPLGRLYFGGLDRSMVKIIDRIDRLHYTQAFGLALVFGGSE
jgi:hypothetical protein